MWRRFIVTVIIALSWLSNNSHAAPLTKLSLALVVADVDCDDWERTDRGVWRAAGIATVITADGNIYAFRRVEVTHKGAISLWWALEVFCRSELDGGM